MGSSCDLPSMSCSFSVQRAPREACATSPLETTLSTARIRDAQRPALELEFSYGHELPADAVTTHLQ